MVTDSTLLPNGYGTNFEMSAETVAFTVTLTSEFFAVQQWIEHTLERVSNELGEDERASDAGHRGAAECGLKCSGHFASLLRKQCFNDSTCSYGKCSYSVAYIVKHRLV